jgi:hypothetical protein
VAAALTMATLAAVSLATADDKLPSTRLFQVIMIEGTLNGTVNTEGIPKVALDTLAGMKDFLPYKGYRLLDTALIRTAMHARTTLKGPKGRPFVVALSVAPGGPSEDGKKSPDLFFRNFAVAETGEAMPPPGAASGRAPGEGDTPAPSAKRELISTSFGMDIGETLVVGSSRLDGDQSALILLVTALP